MRSNSHARSAAQSAPFTPCGVLVRLASNRRAMIVPQRDAIGPVVRSTTCFRKAPLVAPKDAAGNPPDVSEMMPIALRERRAARGTSYRTTISCASPSSSSTSVSSAAASALASPNAGFADGVPFLAIDGAEEGEGRTGLLGAGGVGSPKPSGRSDSGPCCPNAGNANARTTAAAARRPPFVILSVNDANLFQMFGAALQFLLSA